MIEVLKQIVKALECALSEDKPYIDECKQAIQAGKQAIAELESQEPVERNWREAPWGFGEKRLSTVKYSDIVSDGGLDPRNKFDTPPQRTWVGLTDEEVELYWDWEDFQCGCGPSTLFAMVRDIEARLKDRNI